jgi:hypothetical protein
MSTPISAHTRAPPHNGDHHINHRRLDVRVPEVFLDLPDIHPVQQQMRGKAMPLMPRAA